MFGYFLTGDTQRQKVFLIVGPKRSGKGTIGRVLTGLVGPDSVASPTFASLAQNFGLEPLIGKRVGIISDARLGARTDQTAVAERLLSISGEDGLTIDRKFRPAWHGRLSIRFVILTNELPRIADASGALASRFIVLVLEHSFYGREDHGLTDRLVCELPSIFNWSIGGWRRLRDRGHFVPPASSAEAARQLDDLGSPILAFLRDRCRMEAGALTLPAALFVEWRNWCEAQNRGHAGTAQTFYRDLHAAVPTLKVVQPREFDRARCYQGIRLRQFDE